jgi:hypothetical protein
MVFLYNSDNNAPYFDSVLFREDSFWTFSVSSVVDFIACETHSHELQFVLKNCPEATAVLPFVGYVSVGSLANLFPLYVCICMPEKFCDILLSPQSTQAGLTIVSFLFQGHYIR